MAYVLSDADRDLLLAVIRTVKSNPQLRVGPSPPEMLHRASDVTFVNVEVAIPARPDLADPTEYETEVWDIATDTSDGYTVPIIDRPGLIIEPGIHLAVLDRNGLWSIVVSSGSSASDVARFVLLENPTGGGTGATGDHMRAQANFYGVNTNGSRGALIETATLYLDYELFSDLVSGDWGPAAKGADGKWMAMNARCSRPVY